MTKSLSSHERILEDTWHTYAYQNLEDINVQSYEDFLSPSDIKRDIPLTENVIENILRGRKSIEKILEGKDYRMLVLTGPCSIHNVDEAMEYAIELKEISKKIEDKILVVMRTYFEKPRSAEGWQGLLNDPNLDGSNGKNGYILARKLLVEISELGIPCGTEFVEMETPQYIGDAISWACIGARTVESPPHRKMASGLSMPVGFKNSTDGNIRNAINAMIVASMPQSFLGIDKNGVRKMVYTKGNRYGHVVLRGGNKPNYQSEYVKETLETIKKESCQRNSKYIEKIIIDASHGNSGKDYRKQPEVFLDILRQRVDGNKGIAGVMLESYIEEGNQKLENISALKKGISITDSCISIETTRKLLMEAYKVL